MLPAMTGRIRAARSAAVLLAALAPLLVGCAATKSATETVSGWFGAKEAPPRAYYVTAARAKLYREPEASSEVVGQLSRSEGVLSYRVQNGFAWVRAEPSGLSGWVRTTDLADQPPKARAPSRAAAHPTDSPAGAQAPAEPPTPAEAEPEPPAPPEPEPEPPTPPDKSVFDPY
jgi:hypothetical protein